MKAPQLCVGGDADSNLGPEAPFIAVPPAPFQKALVG